MAVKYKHRDPYTKIDLKKEFDTTVWEGANCSVMSDSMQSHGLSPLSMGFSKQEYWSGLPFPSPEDLPNPGIDHWSALQTDSLPSELLGKPLKGNF